MGRVLIYECEQKTKTASYKLFYKIYMVQMVVSWIYQFKKWLNEDAMTRQNVTKWIHEFKEGRMEVHDGDRNGHSSFSIWQEWIKCSKNQGKHL